MFREFKKFALKGNVMDMAIGVIMGAAFGKIVSSIVTDIIMPPIGLLLGGVDFSKFTIVIKQATEITPVVTINYGIFINSVVDFIIIALSVFLVIRQLNKFKKEAKAEEDPAEEIILLREIRDSLKK